MAKKGRVKRKGWLDKLTDRIFGPERNPVVRRAGTLLDQVEALGVAVMAAVVLKYFAIEAFQIPTSSMQPTLMGSSEAGVYDRILVDKTAYLFREPRRWDVAVFRYPLQKNQNYVKRIAGLGGEKLRIAGGNLYRCGEDGEIVGALRRGDLQEGFWKEVYPRRREVTGGGGRILGGGNWFRESGDWDEARDGTLTVHLRDGREASLTYSDGHGGLVNRVWDGYPEEVGRAIKEVHPRQAHLAAVQDARVGFAVAPEGELGRLSVEIDVDRGGQPLQRSRAVIAGGQARLELFVGDSTGAEPVVVSEEVAFAVPAGEVTEVRFARIDDELVLERDGSEVVRLGIGAHRIVSGLERAEGQTRPATTPRILLRGDGEVDVTGVRIERDLHYYLDDAVHFRGPGEVIEVPEDHFFMLGDNTLQSVDSRGWTAITVGALPDLRLVDPESDRYENVTRHRGNKRAMPLDQGVDRDETPIPLPGEDRITMIDEFGEIRGFRTGIGPPWPDPILFEPVGESDTGTNDWQPEEEWVPFVPRRDVVGRALTGFWPFPPFGPNRFGIIR